MSDRYGPTEAAQALPSFSKKGDTVAARDQRSEGTATVLKERPQPRHRLPINPTRLSAQDGSRSLAKILAPAGRAPKRIRSGQRSAIDQNVATVFLVHVIAREQNNRGQRRLLQPQTKPLNVGCVQLWAPGVHVDANASRHHPNKRLLPPNPLYPATRASHAVTNDMHMQVDGAKIHRPGFSVHGSFQ